MNTKKIVQKIVQEATGNQIIEDLTEQAIDAALSDITFDTLAHDFPRAKKQYYKNIKEALMNELNVATESVSSYITDSMKLAFAKALEDKHKEAIEAVQGKDQDSTSDNEDEGPELLTD